MKGIAKRNMFISQGGKRVFVERGETVEVKDKKIAHFFSEAKEVKKKEK